MSDQVEFTEIVNFTIKVDGKSIDTELNHDLTEMVVDSNLHLPDMASLVFFATDTTAIDNDTFKIGKSLEIAVGNAPLFEGEITTFEPVFNEGGGVEVVVRGYDKSHRLHRGNKTRVFAEKTFSDIVSQVAKESGLQAQVESFTDVHAHVWQNNQSDMAFLNYLATRLGMYLYVDGKKLYFKKEPPAAGDAVQFTWGHELRSFRPRMAATHQTDKVVVQSWDPGSKDFVRGEVTTASSTANQGGVTQTGGDIAKAAFGAAELHLVTYPDLTAGEAKVMAQALYDRLHSNFMQAEGRCVGNPKVKGGALVDISGVGTRFSGKYRVATATHTFIGGTYETTFTVTGLQTDVLDTVLNGDDPTEVRALLEGVVPAIITNNADSENLGRVKVKYSWLDDQLESGWIRVAHPGAGTERGLFWTPEVNDEVLIAFEHGDINRPYVLGGLWNGKDAPPKPTSEVVADGKVNERIIQSRKGHVIVFGDKDGEEQIIIRDHTGKNEIVITSFDNSIAITVDQDYTLTAKGKVASTSDDTTTVTSKGDMTIKADGADVLIQGTKITIKGQSSIAVEAASNIDIKANGQLNLKGNMVSIQGQSMTELKSSGVLQLQGSVVKIN